MTDHRITRMVLASCDAASEAAEVLRCGGLVAFPTETVYGLGADAANAPAVAALYRAKGRPSFNPLIAHVANVPAARRLAHFTPEAESLAAAFWPGPLTLVLPKSEACDVSDLATAGLDSIALRVPQHAFARDLLAAFGGAVVAPSANTSGHVSPTTAAHVMDDLAGCIDLIVDGGPVRVGVESTIVSLLEVPTLLRPGGLCRAAIEGVLGRALAVPASLTDDVAPVAPGLLAFGPPLPGATLTLNLSPSGNLDEAAANLFGYLRKLDAAGARAIAAMPVPHHDLGEAINDRLARAAAPRE